MEKTILAVDDSRSMRSIAPYRLSSAGYHVLALISMVRMMEYSHV